MKFTAKSPVRISLCNGGDTDYFLAKMGWSNLINATLASHGYICTVNEKNSLEYIEYIYENTFSRMKARYVIKDINQNDNPYTSLISATLKEIAPKFRGTITISTNVPEKSGLGGSSSLVVALIKAIKKMKNDRATPEEVAKIAYKIERINLGIKGGYQDQWAASYGGGVNYLELKKGDVFIEPLWLHEKLMKKIEDNLILFYMEPRLGDSGKAHELQEKNLKENQKKVLSSMLKKRENVIKTRTALLEGNFTKFAQLLNEEQRLKQSINKETTTEKSGKLYDLAIKNGALAGKISGAGKGGCAFFICPKKKQQKIIYELKKEGAIYLPIKLQRLDSMGTS